MYAVIKTGGKQYRVEKGSTLRVEKLEGETGTKITFPGVLLVADGDKINIGTPVLTGAKVSAEILGIEAGPKLVVFQFRRRKAYRKKTGHRQKYTAVKITDITV